MAAAAGPVYEADAEAVVRRITPPLDRARHKGQAGECTAPSRLGLLHAVLCVCVCVCLVDESGSGQARSVFVFVGMHQRGILWMLCSRICGGIADVRDRFLFCKLGFWMSNGLEVHANLRNFRGDRGASWERIGVCVE